MDEPEKKKKRGRPPKKKIQKDIDDHIDDIDDPIASMASLSALFALADDPRKKQHDKNVKAMCTHVEEYLSNFILIGYTVNGEPVQVTCARSQKDVDSLSTGLQKYIVSSVYGQQFPPGNSF